MREFVRNQSKAHLSIHTPQGYENLESKRVMDLDNPVPTLFADIDISKQTTSGKYALSADVSMPRGTNRVTLEDLPTDWKCTRCKQSKERSNKA